MSELTNRIDTLLTQNQLKRADLCRATGIPDSTIRSWIKGVIPSAEAALKIAKYFGVTIEWLLTGESQETVRSIVLSESEKELIDVFRHLDERDKNAVLTLASSLESQYCSTGKKQLTSG